MKRKNMFTSAVIITTTLSLSIGLSGCGKQGVEPVMAATVEQQTLTYEVTTEEESVIVTEEETESIEETTTDEVETESVTIIEPTITVTTDDNLGLDGEFADGEYNELDEKETDKTVDETANTNETDNDVTAAVAEATGAKTVIIDGEVYIDLGGDDDSDSGYVPPTGDTTPLPPELGPNGSGNDDQGPDFPDAHARPGSFIQ